MSKADKDIPAWKILEETIREQCKRYEVRGEATLSKQTQPVQVIHLGRRVPPRVIHLVNPFLDFSGAWTARGARMLHIECKATQTHRMPLCRDTGIKETQYDAFVRWEKAGCVCGMLWMFNGEIRLVTVASMVAHRLEEAASIKWDDALCIPEVEDNHCDFLNSLAHIYGIA